MLSILITFSINAFEHAHPAGKRSLPSADVSETPSAKRFKPTPDSPALSCLPGSGALPSLAVPPLSEDVCLSLLNAINAQQTELDAMNEQIATIKSKPKQAANIPHELKKKVNKLAEVVKKHTSDTYETKRELNKKLEKKISDLTQKLTEQSEAMEKMRKENETIVATLTEQINVTSAVTAQLSENMSRFLVLAARLYKTDAPLNPDKPIKKEQSSSQALDIESLFADQ